VIAWLARHPRFTFHLYGAISVKRWVASFILVLRSKNDHLLV
jgi:hypothetical protein